MLNELFTVDRRPCIHMALSISGGGAAEQYWSGQSDWCKAIINPTTGLRYDGTGGIPTVDISTNKGVQQLILTMDYYYNRGFRRFMFNSPCGTLTLDGTNQDGYAGWWTPMTQRKIQRKDGVYVPNPYQGCWIDSTTNPTGIVPTLSTVDTAPFRSNGRTYEWYSLLRAWLRGNALGYSGDKLATNPVECYIYSGFCIPYKNNSPDQTRNWLDGNSDAKVIQYRNAPNGYQFPDPDNNTQHSTFLQNELHPWYECGVCGVGHDAGSFAWNHRNGMWVFSNNTKPPDAFLTKTTNIRRWLERDYFALTQGTGSNQRYNTSTKFSYFQESQPYNSDPNMILNRTTNNPFPTADTNEAYSLYLPFGEEDGSFNTKYSAGWVNYSPYLALYDTLNTWKNSKWGNPLNQYNGADPNRKWRFDADTTEVHILVPNVGIPYTDGLYSTYVTLSDSINSPSTQAIVDDTVDFWMDYINRGYIWHPILYHFNTLFERTINKKVMQETGYWPLSDPAP